MSLSNTLVLAVSSTVGTAQILATSGALSQISFAPSSASASANANPNLSASSTSSPAATSSVPSASSSEAPTSAPTAAATSSIPFTTTSSLPSISQSPHRSATGGAALFHNRAAMAAIFTTGGIIALFVILAVALFVVRRKRRKDLTESALDYTSSIDRIVNGGGHSRGGSGSTTVGSHGNGSSSSDALSFALGGEPNVSARDPTPVSVPASIYVPMVRRPASGTDYLGDRWLDREPLGTKYSFGRQQLTPPPQYQQQQPQYQTKQTRPLRLRQQEKQALRASLPTYIDPVPESLMPSRRNTAVFNVPFGEPVTVTNAPRSSVYNGGGDSVPSSRATSTNTRKSMVQVPLPPPGGFPRFIPETVMRDDESWEDLGTVVDEARILKS